MHENGVVTMRVILRVFHVLIGAGDPRCQLIIDLDLLTLAGKVYSVASGLLFRDFDEAR